MKIASALLLAAGVSASEATWVPPDYCRENHHRVNITDLPYVKGDIHPCQYAGTFQVGGPEEDHNLFYWMFRHPNPDADVVVWLNGGPGSSSMFGIFLENGPLRVAEVGGVQEFEMTAAANGWTDDYHMVYIDQPVDTGFSYGNKTIETMEEGAGEFMKFFDRFYQQFYDLKNNSLVLTGESYCGKYLSLFTHEILKRNQAGVEAHIPLEGTLIVDPYVTPVIQRQRNYQVPWGLRQIDSNNMNQISALEQRCLKAMAKNTTEALETCEEMLEYVSVVSGEVLSYNAQLFESDWDKTESPYLDMLTISNRSDELYAAIHINMSTKSPIYESYSPEVGEAYTYDNMLDYSHVYREILDEFPDYSLIIAAGEYDLHDGGPNQPLWFKLIIPANETFWSEDRRVYFFNGSASENMVGGYYKSYHNLTLIVAPKSGHFIPADYYEASKAYLDDLVAHKKLVCKVDGVPSSDDSPCRANLLMALSMNNCSGNGIAMDNGQCVCNANYTGADCASRLNYPSAQALTLKGNGQLHLAYNLSNADNFTITLSPGNSTLDYYVGFGLHSNPNQFEFDLAFRGVDKTINITNHQIPMHKIPFSESGKILVIQAVALNNVVETQIPNIFHTTTLFSYFHKNFGYHHHRLAPVHEEPKRQRSEGPVEAFFEQLEAMTALFFRTK